MSEKLKNSDLFAIKSVITKVKDKGNNNFKLVLILNEMKVDERIEALKKLNQPSKEMEAFKNERNELIQKHAELDEQGNVKVYALADGTGGLVKDGSGYPKITKDKKAYDAAMKKLQTKHKKAIDEAAKKQEEFIKTLEEPVKPEVKFDLVDFKGCPDLAFDEIKVLLPMISK